MLARKAFPRPFPSDAPFTSPAISSTSRKVGVIFSGFTSSAILWSLSSAIGITPTLSSTVQNGKFPTSAPAFVSALKSVDFPTFGSPTIPHFSPIVFPYLSYVYLMKLFGEN